MADNTGGGATPLLSLLIGGLIVAVIAMGIFLYSGAGSSTAPATRTVVVDVNHPAAPQHSWWPWHHDDRRDRHDDHHGH